MTAPFDVTRPLPGANFGATVRLANKLGKTMPEGLPQALADALWRQMQDGALKERLAQRFTDMHHSLLRNTAQESAQAVLDIIGRGA